MVIWQMFSMLAPANKGGMKRLTSRHLENLAFLPFNALPPSSSEITSVADSFNMVSYQSIYPDWTAAQSTCSAALRLCRCNV